MEDQTFFDQNIGEELHFKYYSYIKLIDSQKYISKLTMIQELSSKNQKIIITPHNTEFPNKKINSNDIVLSTSGQADRQIVQYDENYNIQLPNTIETDILWKLFKQKKNSAKKPGEKSPKKEELLEPKKNNSRVFFEYSVKDAIYSDTPPDGNVSSSIKFFKQENAFDSIGEILLNLKISEDKKEIHTIREGIVSEASCSSTFDTGNYYDSMKSNIIEKKYENIHKPLNKIEKQRKNIEKSYYGPMSETKDPISLHKIIPSSVNELFKFIPTLEKNIIFGPYQSNKHYIETNYLLLREDFYSPLRLIIKDIRKGKLDPKHGKIHYKIKFCKKIGESYFLIKIPIDELEQDDIDKKDFDKRFMFRSLLLFTSDKFRNGFFGMVIDKDFSDGELVVSVEKNGPFSESTYHKNYSMLEITEFFAPYYNVLGVFKNLYYSSSRIPFEKYFVQTNTKVCQPIYKQSDIIKYQVDFKDLNESQKNAVKLALNNDLALIQGPPGTGKSFVGQRIVNILLKNKNIWRKFGPILVISSTNNILDQFLEKCIKLTLKICRVGNNSKYKSSVQNLKDIRRKYMHNYGRNYKTPNLDVFLLSNYDIIGMTTSGTAFHHQTIIQQLNCPIVIVDEAAQVLESHILAALTNKCQHLILIGDHKQLRPHTSNHHIATKYNFDVSFFERMVNNGVPVETLNVQYRMRPEISALIRPSIYPILHDHESVLNRPKVRGLVKSVYFIDHKFKEHNDDTSKGNFHEARFLLCLAQYLILNNYKSKEVTIIAGYKAQVEYMKKILTDFPFIQNINITSIDNYQGEESDIILLSLVRNNDRNLIGFLKTHNRVNVALSRARYGLYIMGNMKLLSTNSKLWNVIKKELLKQNAIGKYIVARCNKHLNRFTVLSEASEFIKVPFGGCDGKCNLPELFDPFLSHTK